MRAVIKSIKNMAISHKTEEGVALEQDAISRIESGQRMVQDYELRALAEVLGASMDWLAGKE